METLILDVKIYIASFDQEAWIKMVLYDNVFQCYACTNSGMKKFIDVFHKIKYVNGWVLARKRQCFTTTYLFDKKFNMNGNPAVTSTYGYQEWYYMGKLHRNDDLPAIINARGRKEWWYMGKRHREKDLPAIIDDYIKEWYYDGNYHRENNLHTIMYTHGDKSWWAYGS